MGRRPAPRIEVDVFGGDISAVQSADGRVSAVVTTSATFKNSQAGADAVVDGIVVSAEQEGDVIRIRATNPRNLGAIDLRTDVALAIPPGAGLDLATGNGYVHVGQRLPSSNGGRWMSSPVAVRSVKARDLGDQYTGMEVEILSDASSPTTALDLESRRGSIRIRGDGVLLKARADGGGVEYVGRPAPGLHEIATGPFVEHADSRWRLPRGIRIALPPDTAFEVDAASAGGRVRSEFLPASGASREAGAFAGTIGAAPEIRLNLRSDDGPIDILKHVQSNGSPDAGDPEPPH